MGFFQRRACKQVVLAVGVLVGAAATQAATYNVQTVMSGLSAPRGLAFDDAGALYVTEAGMGGTGPGITSGAGGTVFLGDTSGLSRLQGGVQTRVLSGLPSLANSAGLDAAGLQDIVFDGAQAYGLIGLGANPALRASLGAAGAAMGTLVRLDFSGLGPGYTTVADLGAYELSANPAGDALDSNPFGLALAAGGQFIVADAGGNSFLQLSQAGGTWAIGTLGALSAQPNPLPFGPPVYQAVPTGAAVGPDGAYYFGQLTGFPFVAGAAKVYRYDPATGLVTEAYSGFTNIIDLAFDEDGNLYVLQISDVGLASAGAPGSGLLVKIAVGSGERSVIADSELFMPGGLAIWEGEYGPVFYVSNMTDSADGGSVVRISAVPEPASLALVLVALAGLGLAGRSAQRR